MSSMLGASLPSPLEIRVAMMTTKARGKLSFVSKHDEDGVDEDDYGDDDDCDQNHCQP